MASPAGFLGGHIGFGALLKRHDASIAYVSLTLALQALARSIVANGKTPWRGSPIPTSATCRWPM